MANKQPVLDYQREELNMQVTLELGATEFRAIATRKNAEGKLHVIAADTCPSKGMERGCVKNVDDVAMCIKKLCTLLQNRIDSEQWKNVEAEDRKKSKIESVYVALGGKSILTRENKIERKLGSQTITEELLKEFKQENYHAIMDRDKQILDIENQCYIVDDDDTDSPVGCPCDIIIAKYKLIIGDNKLLGNLKESLKNAGINLQGYVLSPIATAKSVLRGADEELGSVVVDFGASTTNVTIISRNKVNYVYVLPFGSNLLNKDIESLRIVKSEAELLKRGVPCFPVKENPIIPLPSSEKEVSMNEIARIMQTRVDSICTYINQVIVESKLHVGSDLAKLYLIGDGAKLKGFKIKLANALGLPAQFASLNTDLLTADSIINNQTNFAAVIGTAYLSDTANCVSAELSNPRVVKSKGFGTAIKGLMGSLFDNTPISETGATPKQ